MVSCSATMKLTVLITIVSVVGVCGLIAGLITWAMLSDREHPLPSPQELAPLDWWQHCVLYQIYLRSFKDSDGDGIGDLRGIINELDHFVKLGVDAICLSQIFDSPVVDFGDDVRNFYDIHLDYGTLEDFDDLIEQAHLLGLKVILDFIPNHASTKSEYFKKSEAGDSEFEDFFIWADPVWMEETDLDNRSRRLPPSNWISQFGGSAWEWSAKREQYYLHQFAVEQADFNFRNEAVKDEMFAIMKFWLDREVDGFRIAATPYLIEADPNDFDGVYPDDPVSGQDQFEADEVGYTIPLYSRDQMELYDLVYDWRDFIDNYSVEHDGNTRILLTEGYTNISMSMFYYGNEEDVLGAHFPVNFNFITDLSAQSDARDFVYTILKWLTYKPNDAVANWMFGNQDNKRMPTRFRANMVDGLNAISMMLPGVAVTYQGEEIGMKDGFVSWEDTVDVKVCRRENNDSYEEHSRDPARTPYHWDNSTNAGFSSNEDTWLPVADDYMENNLAKQKKENRSHYKVYESLTRLRNTEPALSHGNYIIKPLSKNTFYILRSLPGYKTWVLIFNVSDEDDIVDIKLDKNMPPIVYISSIHSDRLAGTALSDSKVKLVSGEALILRLSTTNHIF